MTNRTKIIVSCCTAMTVGWFTHSMLELTPLAKAVVVGLAAVSTMFVMNAVLPSNEDPS